MQGSFATISARLGRDPTSSLGKLITGQVGCEEVVLHIFRFLNIRDRLALLEVCRITNAIASDNSLWKKLFFELLEKFIADDTEFDRLARSFDDEVLRHGKPFNYCRLSILLMSLSQATETGIQSILNEKLYYESIYEIFVDKFLLGYRYNHNNAAIMAKTHVAYLEMWGEFLDRIVENEQHFKSLDVILECIIKKIEVGYISMHVSAMSSVQVCFDLAAWCYRRQYQEQSTQLLHLAERICFKANNAKFNPSLQFASRLATWLIVENIDNRSFCISDHAIHASRTPHELSTNQFNNPEITTYYNKTENKTAKNVFLFCKLLFLLMTLPNVLSAMTKVHYPPENSVDVFLECFFVCYLLLLRLYFVPLKEYEYTEPVRFFAQRRNESGSSVTIEARVPTETVTHRRPIPRQREPA